MGTWTKIRAGEYVRGEDFTLVQKTVNSNGWLTNRWEVAYKGTVVGVDTYFSKAKNLADYFEAQLAKGLVDPQGNPLQPETVEAVVAPVRGWIYEELARANKEPSYDDPSYYRNEGRINALEEVLEHLPEGV